MTTEAKADKAHVTIPAAERKARRVGLSTDDRVLELLSINERIKELREEANAIEEELLELLPVGEPRRLSDGRTVVLQDNFVSGNVCFRPAAVRHFEVVLTKEKRWC